MWHFPKARIRSEETREKEEEENDEEEKEEEEVGAGVPTKPIARWPEEHPLGSRGLWR